MKALFLREWRMLFTATSTWVVALAMVFAPGMHFLIELDTYWEWDVSSMIAFLNRTLIVLVPALTMITVAGERESQTWNLLRSDPVTPGQIVIVKYLVLLIFYCVMVSFSLGTALYFISETGDVFDLGRQLGSVLSHFFVAAWYLAIGLACSAHARSQISSFILTFVVIMIFTFMGQIGENLFGNWGHVITIDNHIVNFYWGLVRFNDVFYFVSGILLFLTLAGRFIMFEPRSRMHVVWKFLPIPFWIVFWVMIQAHVLPIDRTFDFSRLGVTQPSQVALQKIKNVNDKIKIISVWSSHDDMVSIIEGYLQNLAAFKSNFTYQSLRLHRDNEAIANVLNTHRIPYDAIKDKGIVVLIHGDDRHVLKTKDIIELMQSPGKSKFRRFKGEFYIVRSLLKLSGKKSGKIAVLKAANSEVQGEESGIYLGPISNLGLVIDKAVPIDKLSAKEYPLCFFINPKDKWEASLNGKLDQYRADGGHLVLMMDAHSVLTTPLAYTTHIKDQLRDGPYQRAPELISGQFPEYLINSYGDPQIIFDAPFYFKKNKAKVFFRDRRTGHPLSVTFKDGLTLMGDCDWMRVGLWKRANNKQNPVGMQMFTEFLLKIDDHHHVRKLNLDVDIQPLDDKARQDMESWLLYYLPGMLISLALGFALWRRFK